VSSELRVVGLAEVAELLGVSKRTATRYAARADFPKPAAQLAMGPIWFVEDVEEWIRKAPIRRGRPPTRTSRT
jgi:predicted DNA-binding transcriptional regulator AlpA